MKSLAIMQPTFLPWVGYFALMGLVDEFIYLDDVQFNRRSWQQRNQIKTSKGLSWLTVPVLSKGARDQLIHDIRIDKSSGFFKKAITAIQHNYSKAPFYSDYSESIFSIFEKQHEFLCDLNIELNAYFRRVLNISTPILMSSSLEVEGKKADLIFNICSERNASHYISPSGSSNYLDDASRFRSDGIDLTFFQYEHPTWSQLHQGFEPYVSVIDLLFNEGERTQNILKKGIKLQLRQSEKEKS